MEHHQVIIIGAGQAGLATSWRLKQAGIDHIVLEATQHTGGAWRSYYDSLTLFSPARYSSLPGLSWQGEQGRYPKRDEVVAYLSAYVAKFDLPVRNGISVYKVERVTDGFLVTTGGGGRYQAQSIIAASGAFGRPYVPQIPGLTQFKGRAVHSAHYTAPKNFAGQRVVVVGAGNSSVQIAMELAEVSKVTLATREPVKFFPQRILGLDFHFWVKWTGLEQTRWLKDQGTPVLDDGQYRKAFASGHLVRKPMFKEITPDGVTWADGKTEQVDTLLFATGFRPNVSYLEELGVFDDNGQLNQKNGVSENIPGLFFMGFPLQRNFASATLRGANADSAYLMPHINSYLAAPQTS